MVEPADMKYNLEEYIHIYQRKLSDLSSNQARENIIKEKCELSEEEMKTIFTKNNHLLLRILTVCHIDLEMRKMNLFWNKMYICVLCGKTFFSKRYAEVLPNCGKTLTFKIINNKSETEKEKEGKDSLSQKLPLTLSSHTSSSTSTIDFEDYCLDSDTPCVFSSWLSLNCNCSIFYSCLGQSDVRALLNQYIKNNNNNNSSTSSNSGTNKDSNISPYLPVNWIDENGFLVKKSEGNSGERIYLNNKISSDDSDNEDILDSPQIMSYLVLQKNENNMTTKRSTAYKTLGNVKRMTVPSLKNRNLPNFLNKIFNIHLLKSQHVHKVIYYFLETIPLNEGGLLNF